MNDYISIKKYNYTIIRWLPLLIVSVNRKSTDQHLVSQCSIGIKRKRGTIKAISPEMTVYDKKNSSQCNLTAQIEQVHYKRIYVSVNITFLRL
jgi:hypothetical protein